MRRRYALLLACLLLLPRLTAGAGLPVFDAGLNALGVKEEWDQLQKWWEMVRQTANQAKQIQNQIKQIEHMYTQIDQATRNLARLEVHNITDLYGMVHQLESKLYQAHYIGYLTQSAVTQAQTLYPRVYGVLTFEQQRAFNLQWATMHRNAAQVAIATQAIHDAQMRYQQQWADLIRRAQAVEGNVQAQQTQVQAQALVGNQLLAIEQQLATQARERSEVTLEIATRVEIEQHLTDKALGPLEGTYVPQGRLLPAPRTGRE